MNLKKIMLVFFLILSFEGSGFSQLAQMSPAKPSSEEITLEKPSNTKDGIKDPQRLSPEQLKQLGIKDSSLPPLPQSVPSQKPVLDKPDQLKKVPTAQTSPQTPEAESLSEFEHFVARGTMGKISTNIRQFGYDLFRQPPSTFALQTEYLSALITFLDRGRTANNHLGEHRGTMECCCRHGRENHPA